MKTVIIYESKHHGNTKKVCDRIASECGTVLVSFDGRTHEFGGVMKIEVTHSDKEIRLIRTKSYDHWGKLSSKLL